MGRGFAFLLLLAPAFAGPAAQGQTPAVRDVGRTDPLRRALLDALRPEVERDLGQKLIFVVQLLRAEEGWAFATVVPRTPAGAHLRIAGVGAAGLSAHHCLLHNGSQELDDTPDTAQVIVRPPLAWALAVIVGLALDWLVPLPFLPARLPAGWLGPLVFVLGLALFAWAISTITRAGSNVPTNRPTTTILESGPYRFTRNPIYLGMFIGLIGLAVGFDTLWLLLMLVPFAIIIRYGVVAREEAYLERRFGDVYLRYRSRVRRWL